MTQKKPTEQEYLLAVGEIITMASSVDLSMFTAFSLLTGLQLNKAHEIAKAIYYTLDSATAKQKMLRRIADAVRLDKEKKAALEALIAANEDANKQRQEFSHTPYGIGENNVVRRLHMKHPYSQSISIDVTAGFLRSKKEAMQKAEVDAMNALADLIGRPPK